MNPEFNPYQKGSYPYHKDDWPTWPKIAALIIGIFLVFWGILQIVLNVVAYALYDASTTNWFVTLAAGVIYMITGVLGIISGILYLAMKHPGTCGRVTNYIFLFFCAFSILMCIAGIVTSTLGLVWDNWPWYVYRESGINNSGVEPSVLEARVVFNACILAFHIVIIFFAIAGASLGCRDSCCGNKDDPYSDYKRMEDKRLDPYSDTRDRLGAQRMQQEQYAMQQMQQEQQIAQQSYGGWTGETQF